jgi:hypothetical protein
LPNGLLAQPRHRIEQDMRRGEILSGQHAHEVVEVMNEVRLIVVGIAG